MPSLSETKSTALSEGASLARENQEPVEAKAEIVRRILRALAGIEYGSVEIIVQDSKVVQIERHQKARFARPLEIPPA